MAALPLEPELEVGQVVVFKKRRAHTAVVRFVGETHFAPGTWVGIEYGAGSGVGKNDGSKDGIRYFECAPRSGSFVRPEALLVFEDDGFVDSDDSRRTSLRSSRGTNGRNDSPHQPSQEPSPSELDALFERGPQTLSDMRTVRRLRGDAVVDPTPPTRSSRTTAARPQRLHHASVYAQSRGSVRTAGAHRASRDYYAPGSVDVYGVNGMRNLGNTCFLNSVVQNMLQLGPLRRHFDRDMAAGTGEAAGDGSHERAMMRALRALFEDNWDPLAGAAVLNPSDLHAAVCRAFPMFRGRRQHDAGELYRKLVDRLRSDDRKRLLGLGMERSAALSANVIHATFGGNLESLIQCCACGNTHAIREPFTEIPLQFPRDLLKAATSASSSFHRRRGGQRPTTLFRSTVSRSALPNSKSPSGSSHVVRASASSSGIDDEKMDGDVGFSFSAAAAGSGTAGALSDTDLVDLASVLEDVGGPSRVANSPHGGAAEEEPSVSPRPDPVVSKEMSLENLLRRFTASETLEYSCASCASESPAGGNSVRGEARRCYRFQRPLPSVLVFQLSRFRSSRVGIKKIATAVEVPPFLDMEPFCTEGGADDGGDGDGASGATDNDGTLFVLRGVVVHGGGMGGGHYVAYVRRQDDARADNTEVDGERVWFRISDSRLKATTLDAVLRAQAYLLFYERVSV